MSSQKLFEIVLKVIGVLCVIWGIAAVAGGAISIVTLSRPMAQEQAQTSALLQWIYVAIPLLYFAVAGILFSKAHFLAAKLMPEAGEVQLTLGDNQSAFTLALRVLGAYLLTDSIIGLGGWAAGYASSQSHRGYWGNRPEALGKCLGGSAATADVGLPSRWRKAFCQLCPEGDTPYAKGMSSSLVMLVDCQRQVHS